MIANSLLLLLLLLLLPSSISLPLVSAFSTSLRGVAPQDESYYTGAIIWCKDKSKSFTRDRLNDDFCDCPDGTDEPGTSACPEGKFYCKNMGHTPLLLFSSRVNDGICDCCDGSDEFDGKANCPDTCWEAGKDLRKKLEKRIAILKEGIDIRKRDIEHAKRMIQQDKAELSNFKQEEKKLKEIVNILKAKKEEIEKAETQERMEREKEQEKRREAEQQLLENEALETKETSSPGEKPTAEDTPGDAEQENIKAESSTTESTDDMSKEELGRLIASRWTGEDPSLEKDEVEQDLGTDNDEDMYDSQNEDFNTPVSENEENEDFKDDDDDGDDDDNEEDFGNESNDAPIESAESTDSPGSDFEVADTHENYWFWTKPRHILRSVLGALKLYRLPVDKSEADNIRKQYKEATSKLTEIQSKVSDLEKKLEQDFGAEGEFYALYDRCFEMKQNKYVYKVCPYKHSLQVEGHSSTTLGNWDGFKDDYKSMHFVRGDKCWNGPDRTLKAKLRCGVKTEIRDVEEPSRCEYVAEISTPAVCLDERLMALQKQLNYQAREPLSIHEEL